MHLCSVQRPALGAALGTGPARRARTLAPHLLPRPSTHQCAALSDEPARPVALPSGALWLLDTWQDQFYSVRGEAFVIARSERVEEQPVFKQRYHRMKNLLQRVPPLQGKHGLIHQVVWEQPCALMLMSDDPPFDVQPEEVSMSEVADADAADAASASAAGSASASTVGLVWVPDQPAAAPTTTGIVHVPSVEAEGVEDGMDVIQTSSTSPRRTKLLRFTCLADGCQTVNVKPINPLAFKKGTAFAQCAKCAKWHLIRDHLRLWDQMKGPLPFAARARGLTNDDVPESLRIKPEDMDWINGGGRAGGYKRSG